VIIGAFLLETTPVLIKAVYDDDSAADACTFVEYIIETDDFGNPQKTMIAKFSFSRRLFEKVNWDNFDASKLPLISLHYETNPVVTARMKQEQLNAAE